VGKVVRISGIQGGKEEKQRRSSGKVRGSAASRNEGGSPGWETGGGERTLKGKIKVPLLRTGKKVGRNPQENNQRLPHPKEGTGHPGPKKKKNQHCELRVINWWLRAHNRRRQK